MASFDCVGWRFWYNAAMDLTVLQPSRVTVMIKPVGALCNLDCTYCYYLPTKEVYGGHERRMGLDTLRNIFAGILPRFADEVTIAWQGGEPTLAGLDFFRHAIALQNQYARPTQRFHHALQTNGTLLDDEWCKFLHDNEFLIGLSVDGPPRFHDHYRLTNRQGPSSDLVLQGLRLLQKHGVEYNILCVLNNVNVDHPEEVLHYLLNLGSRWLQFIPAVEWEKDPSDPNRNILAPYSPDPEAYGRFLCRVFDLWFERYRKRVSIRLFDAVLNKLVLGQMPFCILDGSCHNQLTIEHDGAVFGCDHFVERRWQLGQIGQPGWTNEIRLDGSTEVGLTVHGTGYRKLESHAGRDIDRIADVADVAASVTHDSTASSSPATATATANDGVDEAWLDRLEGARLGAFAARKQNLPAKCKACEWKAFCHGGCPKHRSHGGDVPEPTVLCQSYMMFYGHAMPRLNWLAGYLRQDQQPPDPDWASETGASRSVASPAGVVAGAAPKAGRGATPGAIPGAVPGARPGVPGVARVSSSGPGRNDPCPCGSGLKYKKCHGKNL